MIDYNKRKKLKFSLQLEGFSHTLSFRLISPSKSDIGKISKSVLDKMNNAIVSTTRVNQWRKTSTDVY